MLGQISINTKEFCHNRTENFESKGKINRTNNKQFILLQNQKQRMEGKKKGGGVGGERV